jgi:hypothetical protein
MEEILKMLELELSLFKERELMHLSNKNYFLANENKVKANLTEVYIVKVKNIINAVPS